MSQDEGTGYKADGWIANVLPSEVVRELVAAASIANERDRRRAVDRALDRARQLYPEYFRFD